MNNSTIFFLFQKKYSWVIILTVLLCFSQKSFALRQTSAIDSLKRQIKQLLFQKKLKEAAQSYENLGWLYHQQYGYNKYTIDAYFNSLKYYNLVRDSLGYYNAHIQIGDYYSQDFFMQAYAEKYLKRALLFFVKTGNASKIIQCRLGLANMHGKADTIPRQLLTELRTTEEMCIKYKQDYYHAYALNLLANSYLLIKMPDSARYFAHRSLILSRQQHISWLISLNYFYLGLTEQFKDNAKAALANYSKSYTIAEAEKNISTMRELSKHSADSYAHMGDYKNAYEASLKTLDFTNQFYYSGQTKSIHLQELDNEIKTLAIEKQLAEEQSQHQYVINLTLGIFLIASTLGVVALISMRRQQKLISHQQAVIAQQQIRDLELKSLRAMIEGQEGERSRIARDLHDGLGIQLSRIKLFVEAHQELMPITITEPLNQFLDEACTETRSISNDLMPYTLSAFGLFPALDDLNQKLNLVNETHLVIDHYGEIMPMSDEASVMVYRVVQELLNNALKHAHAQKITTQIMTDTETILISVDDDGKGADFTDPRLKNSGIANIKSRINYLGGQVIWQSKPGAGTTVMISLPVSKIIKNSLV